MKKIFVMLFILLSAQLYGCANQVSEISETVPSVSELDPQEPETLSVQENDTNEKETLEKEIYDDNSDISAEPQNELASDLNTENMDTSVQDTALQPEETVTTDTDNYYSAATDISSADVESYAAGIKQLFLEHDWQAISSEISYPITISDITYHNSAEFLEASDSFDSSLEEAFFTALEKESCEEMFCNWEGIMLGETGEIWISEVLDAEFTSQGLKITAINGMLKHK